MFTVVIVVFIIIFAVIITIIIIILFFHLTSIFSLSFSATMIQETIAGKLLSVSLYSNHSKLKKILMSIKRKEEGM